MAQDDEKALLIKNATGKTLVVIVGGKNQPEREFLHRLVAPLGTMMVPFKTIGTLNIAPHGIEHNSLWMFPYNYAGQINPFIDLHKDLQKISLEIYPPQQEGFLGPITAMVRPYSLIIGQPDQKIPNGFELSFNYILSLLRRNPQADITAADILGLNEDSATFGPFMFDQYREIWWQQESYWKGVYGSGPTLEDIKKIIEETEQIYRELLGAMPHGRYQREDKDYARIALEILDLTNQLLNEDIILRNKELLWMMSPLSDPEATIAVQKVVNPARIKKTELLEKIRDHFKNYIQSEA